MGANIALNFASHGLAVRLTDVSVEQLSKAKELARGNAAFLRENGLLPGFAEEILARVVYTSDRDVALAGAELVIEAIPESLPLKRSLFAELDRGCGSEVVFASNTSTFLPSTLATSLVHPERRRRFMVLHYWNPAHLIPLVEIVPHPEVDFHVLEDVQRLLERCQKQPVVLRKEVPGFIGNRLAFALQREAMDLVARGVATAEEIDTVARTSFGRRLPVSGIFGTADLGGLDVYLAVCASLFPDLSNQQEPPAALASLVKAGKLGVKSGAGWRSYTGSEIVALRESLATELVHQAKLDRQFSESQPPEPPSRS